LASQAFCVSANFKSLLERRLECIPLTGKNFAPNDPHVHVGTSRSTVLCDVRRKRQMDIFQLADWLDCQC
jgi:hypothetical protein